MALRDSILFQLKLARGCDNAFTRARVKRPARGRFMRGRQAPLSGWRDRMSGHYSMTHNKIREESDL